ncbi:MAG: hypothetical protein IPL65_06025 [Lewinellaceae bacterium]|nr:hypothetical protein [Lewinellaceae bacterium]
MQADSTKIPEFGRAHDQFEKYIELALPDQDKELKNLITAYEYLVYYHFVKKEDVEALRLANDLLKLDPSNATGLGTKETIEKSADPGKGSGGGKK